MKVLITVLREEGGGNDYEGFVTLNFQSKSTSTTTLNKSYKIWESTEYCR